MTSEESVEETGGERLGSASRLEQLQETRHLDLTESRYSIYECRECDNIALTVNPSEEELSCHEQRMREITEWEMEVNPPELREVLLNAFGLPKVGIDICLCVIGEGPLSAGEVADLLDYDQSTVSRYLNELADIGLLEKAQLNRESGGFVNVFHSIDLDKMRRETLVGFYVWAGEAASLIEEANLTKEEYLEEDHSKGLQEVFWQDFQDD